MTRQEVIERYCILASEVWNQNISPAHPNDCFCGSGGFWGSPGYAETDYRNDGQALDFIERIVRAELARLQAEPTQPQEDATT